MKRLRLLAYLSTAVFTTSHAYGKSPNPYVNLIQEIRLMAEESEVPLGPPLPDLPSVSDEEFEFPSINLGELITGGKNNKDQEQAETSSEEIKEKVDTKKQAKKKKRKKKVSKKIKASKTDVAEKEKALDEEIEKLSQEIDTLQESATVNQEEIWNPLPRSRPRLNYKVDRLPKMIYRKSYSKENAHLPSAHYESEYKKLLFASVANNRIDLIRSLVDYYKSTEIRDPVGNTPLIYATMLGNQQSILALIGMGANTDAINYAGINALTIALKNTDMETLKILLNANADPDRRTVNGYTSLHTAALLSNNIAIELLLDHEANPNIKTKKGNIPLHITTAKGNNFGSYLLINYGSYIDNRNFQGETPLMVAATRNKIKTANLLLNAGAGLSKRNALGLNALQMALRSRYYQLAQLIETEQIRRQLAVEKRVTATRRTQKKELLRDVIETSTMLPPIPETQKPIMLDATPALPRPILKSVSHKPRPTFSIEEEHYLRNNQPHIIEN